MEDVVVALGTLFTLAVIMVRVLWQERALCKHAIGRALTVARAIVRRRPALEREAVAKLPYAHSSLSSPGDPDSVPPTWRSRR